MACTKSNNYSTLAMHLMNFGVDRYKRPEKISINEEKARQEEREAYLQSQVNELMANRSTIENQRRRHQSSLPERATREPALLL